VIDIKKNRDLGGSKPRQRFHRAEDAFGRETDLHGRVRLDRVPNVASNLVQKEAKTEPFPFSVYSLLKQPGRRVHRIGQSGCVYERVSLCFSKKPLVTFIVRLVEALIRAMRSTWLA
jgi:hypothetical protein